VRPTTEDALLGRAAAIRRTAGRGDVAYRLAVGWIALVVAAVLLAPVLRLAEHDDPSRTLAVPGFLRPHLLSAHPLGTNRFGLDLLARVVWGGRESLLAAALAVVAGTLVGGFAGILAGYLAGVWDRAIGVAATVGLAFPPLVLLIVVAAALGGGALNLGLALSLLVLPATVRIARAYALAVAARDFAYTARMLGATRWQVLRREIVPAVAPALVSVAFLALPWLVVTEASLGFLGLGVQQPRPSWGNMLAEGANGVFEANPHIVLVPGAVLFLTVFSLNIVGQRAARRWDPRR
jgi:peptide/nickel transport system permease protein